MNIQPIKIGASVAIATALLWVFCSISVYLLPEQTMLISGHMMHTNLADMNWVLTWSGFFIALVAWTAVAGISAWLIAVIYKIFD